MVSTIMGFIVGFVMTGCVVVIVIFSISIYNHRKAARAWDEATLAIGTDRRLGAKLQAERLTQKGKAFDRKVGIHKLIGSDK